MTTYYRIQTWSNGFSSELYETFDDACDAIEEDMKSYIEYMGADPENNKLEIITATREEKLKYIQEWKEILYYKNSSGRKFHIVMMKVVPKKKTSVYSIHAYDQESRYLAGEDRIDNRKLYTTFEKACEEIEKMIQAHIKYFNSEEEEEVFRAPNREEMKKKMTNYVHYYETSTLWLWVISKWEVDE